MRFMLAGGLMAQRLEIIGFFVLVGTFALSGTCFGETRYIAAFGKAEAAYSSWLADKSRQGVKPTAAERHDMHKSMFADAHAAFVADQVEYSKTVIKMGHQFMRDLKNYNPPAKQEQLADDIDGRTLKDVAKATPSRSVANVADRGTNDAKATLDVKAGSADAVSFKAQTGGAPTTAGPSFKGSTGEVGGANAVTFSKPGATVPAVAPAPIAVEAKPAAPTPTGDEGGGTAVSFSAPAGTADAGATHYNTPAAAAAVPTPAPSPAPNAPVTSKR